MLCCWINAIATTLSLMNDPADDNCGLGVERLGVIGHRRGHDVHWDTKLMFLFETGPSLPLHRPVEASERVAREIGLASHIRRQTHFALHEGSACGAEKTAERIRASGVRLAGSKIREIEE